MAGKVSDWAGRWLTTELQTLARAGDWMTALATFQQLSPMTEHEDMPVSSSSASSLLSSSSSSTSSSSSSTTANPKLTLDQQRAKLVHYTTIISACARAEQWQPALQVFTHMTKTGRVAPNVRTYTALIHACSTGNKLDLAMRAWAMMEADGIVSNNYATTALVTAFARAGKWQEATRTLLEAETNPFPSQEPNVFTYTAAMEGSRRAGQCGNALAILKRMRERGVRPNTVTYTTALQACAGAATASVSSAASSSDGDAHAAATVAAEDAARCAVQVLELLRADRVALIPAARAAALEALVEAPAEVAERGEALVGPVRGSMNLGNGSPEFKSRPRDAAEALEGSSTDAAMSASVAQDLLQDPRS